MSKIEYEFPLDNMVSRIFKMFHIFYESSFVSDEDNIPMVLLLLTMFKDGLINYKMYPDSDNFEKFIETINELSNGTHENTSYQRILQIMQPSLSKINKTSFCRACQTLDELDITFFKENFAKVFDDVLYRVSQSQGRYAGEFLQPVELTRLISGLTVLKPQSKVYNPFAGLASFSIYLDPNIDYYGQEKHEKRWVIGVLRLMAYRQPERSKYVCEDSIINWPKPFEKFDLIVANPPFGLPFDLQYRDIEPNFKTVEQFLVEKGIQSLTPNGKLIAIFPQGFLYREMQEKRLRVRLVEDDLIDTIISLPSGLLQNTGIPFIILVLDRNKKNPGKVKFVDAKSFVNRKSSLEKVLNDHELNSFIRNDIEDESVIRIIDNQEIRDKNYNLSVSRYFQKQIDGVKLGEILEIVRGQRVSLPEIGKHIRIRDLKDDKVDFKLDLSGITEVELRRPDIHLISESCLLLGLRGRTLKPTLFEFKGEPIFINQDIVSYTIDESRADKAYLINELHASYVQEQLESYRMGDFIMAFIRKDDLMEVVIKLPSLEEQRAKVQGIYEISKKIEMLQNERNALNHGKSMNQFNEFASLKHTLGRPRQNILDWTDNLLDFLSKSREGFEPLNKEFAEFYDQDIIFSLKEIKRDINFITEVLEKGENGLVLSEYEKQIISLSDINSIINELSNNGFKFKIKRLLLIGEKLKERGIQANKTLLKTLLDNILTNANKYAFESKNYGNEVVIELTEIDDFLSIEIKNNGKSFPKNFDREKFITKYSTADSATGGGLGGYDIHRIATDFDNQDWILSLDEDPFYPVIFKFQFSIKLIE